MATCRSPTAGWRGPSASVSVGRYRAPSVEAFVRTEVESTPLAERLSPEVYGRIRTEAAEVLATFTTDDGSVDAPFFANVVVDRRGYLCSR